MPGQKSKAVKGGLDVHLHHSGKGRDDTFRPMLDLLLKNVRLPGGAGLTQVGLRDGLIAVTGEEAKEVVDLGGALVTPALVEPHIHLDAVLTVGEPRQNLTGSLFEGIPIWAEA